MIKTVQFEKRPTVLIFFNIQKSIILAPKKWQKAPNLDWFFLQIEVIFGPKY